MSNTTYSPADQVIIVDFVWQQRFADPFLMSAVALFIYDYGLTLHREIKLIWFSRWSYTKVLFLLVRYLTFADTYLLLHNQLFPNVSANSCKLAYTAAVWLVTLKVSLAEVILALRTWAVWRQNKVVGVVLAVLMVANMAVQCYFAYQSGLFLGGWFLDPMYPGFRGCYAGLLSVGRADLPDNYVALTILEGIVLVLMLISAFRLYRAGAMGELSRITHRDGILFYVILLGITAANVGIGYTRSGIAFNASKGSFLQFSLTGATTILLTPLEGVLYSVLTTRIVLNIRDWDNQSGLNTELHTCHSEPLKFAKPVRRHDQDAPDSTVTVTSLPQHSMELYNISDNDMATRSYSSV